MSRQRAIFLQVPFSSNVAICEFFKADNSLRQRKHSLRSVLVRPLQEVSMLSEFVSVFCNSIFTHKYQSTHKPGKAKYVSALLAWFETPK